MRKAIIASAVVVLIGGSGTYALVGRPTEKAGETKAKVVEAPRVEKARLFAPVHDVSPTPASDLIAVKLASEPVSWPHAPKPVVQQNSVKPVAAKKQPQARVVQAKKPTAAHKPKQALKPKSKSNSTLVTGSL